MTPLQRYQELLKQQRKAKKKLNEYFANHKANPKKIDKQTQKFHEAGALLSTTLKKP